MIQMCDSLLLKYSWSGKVFPEVTWQLQRSFVCSHLPTPQKQPSRRKSNAKKAMSSPITCLSRCRNINKMHWSNEREIAWTLTCLVILQHKWFKDPCTLELLYQYPVINDEVGVLIDVHILVMFCRTFLQHNQEAFGIWRIPSKEIEKEVGYQIASPIERWSWSQVCSYFHITHLFLVQFIVSRFHYFWALELTKISKYNYSSSDAVLESNSRKYLFDRKNVVETLFLFLRWRKTICDLTTLHCLTWLEI